MASIFRQYPTPGANSPCLIPKRPHNLSQRSGIFVGRPPSCHETFFSSTGICGQIFRHFPQFLQRVASATTHPVMLFPGTPPSSLHDKGKPIDIIDTLIYYPPGLLSCTFFVNLSLMEWQTHYSKSRRRQLIAIFRHSLVLHCHRSDSVFVLIEQYRPFTGETICPIVPIFHTQITRIQVIENRKD